MDGRKIVAELEMEAQTSPKLAIRIYVYIMTGIGSFSFEVSSPDVNHSSLCELLTDYNTSHSLFLSLAPLPWCISHDKTSSSNLFSVL